MLIRFVGREMRVEIGSWSEEVFTVLTCVLIGGKVV